MKNSFQKNDHKLLIAGIAVGTVAIGATAYLLLTETGAELRERVTNQFNTWFGRQQQEAAVPETPAYMQHKGARPKTDREHLIKGDILHHEGENPSEEQQG